MIRMQIFYELLCLQRMHHAENNTYCLKLLILNVSQRNHQNTKICWSDILIILNMTEHALAYTQLFRHMTK